MSIITEDLPDYEVTEGWSGWCGDQPYEITAGERIDDLRIYVVYDGGLWAGVIATRQTSLLPFLGCMSVSGNSLNVELHEIGHVLGIGTIWNLGQDLSGDTHFNGPLAIAAFNDAGGRNYTGKKVPVERDGSHWRFSVLTGELMGGGQTPSGTEPLSAITIQALADLGYSVDVTQAEPYTLPSAAKASAKSTASPTHAQPEWACGVGEQREPIYVVDQQGRIIRTLHR